MRFNATALCIPLMCSSLLLSLGSSCGKTDPPADSPTPAPSTATAQTSESPIATSSTTTSPTPTPRSAASAATVTATVTPSPTPSPSLTLEGAYTLNDATATQRISDGIERSVHGMLAFEDAARKALKEANLPPPGQIDISYNATEVTIASDVVGSLKTAVNGKPTDWTRNGEEYKVSTKWENGNLVSTFKGDARTRVNTYSLSDDGKSMAMQVHATGGRLLFKIKPLDYVLSYKRTAK